MEGALRDVSETSIVSLPCKISWEVGAMGLTPYQKACRCVSLLWIRGFLMVYRETQALWVDMLCV